MWHTAWKDFLDRQNKDHQLRRLLPVSPDGHGTTRVHDRSTVNLSSNDYLGLSKDPRVIEAATLALKKYGTGAGSSRLVTGHFMIHEQLEAQLAAWKETEQALVFSSGYAANVGLLTALLGPDDHVFSDALNHASIIDGCRLSRARIHIYRHNDMTHLESLIRRRQGTGRLLIVTDGVFSMDGDLAPLPALSELAKTYEALLVVDDAHGTGVLGPDGRGTVHHLGISGPHIIQVGTLSKALASQGGFVAGSTILIQYLINRSRSFIYSTGLAPAAAAAAQEAIAIAQTDSERRSRPIHHARQFVTRLQASGIPLPIPASQILQIPVGPAVQALALSRQLLESGVWAPAIRPPTVPEGTSRIRVAFNSAHRTEDVAQAAEIFAQLLGPVIHSTASAHAVPKGDFYGSPD